MLEAEIEAEISKHTAAIAELKQRRQAMRAGKFAERDRAIEKDWRANVPVKEIAAKFKMKPGNVVQLRLKHGWPPRKPVRDRPHGDKIEAMRRAYEEDATPLKISAARLGVSGPTLCRYAAMYDWLRAGGRR